AAPNAVGMSSQPTAACGSARRSVSAAPTSTSTPAGPRPPSALSSARALASEDRGGQARGDPRPTVVKLLRERWLVSPFKGANAFVVANTLGAASTTATSASASARPPNVQA